VDFDKREYPWYSSVKVIYHHCLHDHGLTSHVAGIIDVSVDNIQDDPFAQVICFCNIPHSFFDSYDYGESPVA
jgi:hypothetical protein